jgi:hypothetical protein
MVIDGVAGHIELAHFAGLERVLAARVAVDRHMGSTAPSAARRVLLSGALTVTAGPGCMPRTRASLRCAAGIGSSW